MNLKYDFRNKRLYEKIPGNISGRAPGKKKCKCLFGSIHLGLQRTCWRNSHSYLRRNFWSNFWNSLWRSFRWNSLENHWRICWGNFQTNDDRLWRMLCNGKFSASSVCAWIINRFCETKTGSRNFRWNFSNNPRVGSHKLFEVDNLGDFQKKLLTNFLDGFFGKILEEIS